VGTGGLGVGVGVGTGGGGTTIVVQPGIPGMHFMTGGGV
jgi:hypothetical protein